MALLSKTGTSYVAAALLAGITLFSFTILQDFGPRSAIRRFHEAAVRHDLKELNKLTVEGIDSSNSQYLAASVDKWAGANATYDITALRSYPGLAVASIEYSFPKGAPITMLWYVQKGQSDWRINARRTLTELAWKLGSTP